MQAGTKKKEERKKRTGNAIKGIFEAQFLQISAHSAQLHTILDETIYVRITSKGDNILIKRLQYEQIKWAKAKKQASGWRNLTFEELFLFLWFHIALLDGLLT